MRPEAMSKRNIPEAMRKRDVGPAGWAHRDGERYGLRRTLGTSCAVTR